MSDADFLSQYDPSAFPPMAVAVDIVVLTANEQGLFVLTAKRAGPPHRGKYALPGVLVQVDEAIDDAARRAVETKVGVRADVRQFGAFGAVDRDPRMRVVSIGYAALLPWGRLEASLGVDQQLCRIDGEVLRDRNGRKLSLPFDHHAIVQSAVEHLRADLDQSLWSFGLLEPEFTLRELQQVHEAVRGRVVNKPAFRKRLLDSGKLEATGRFEVGSRFRPAELYRVGQEWRDGER
jgi:8-oxo-dGTP diphosphatase